MSNFSQIIKNKRLELGLRQNAVSEKLGMDVALLSRLERGERLPTRPQVSALIDFYKLEERNAFSAWLSDKILAEIKDESYGLDALMLAESEVRYDRSIRKQEYSDEILGLLEKADELRDLWIKSKPLGNSQLQKMKEYFDINYTYESNKIEGNTLTLQETYLVIKDGITVGGKTMQEHLEAINHSEAIDFIADIVRNKERVTERLLKEIHYLILKGIDRQNAGVYRKVPVMISGASHRPPQPYLIDRKMEEVFEYYEANKGKLHPIILAADMHEKIVTVHPFIDGNGRTSRLMMNLILLRNGYTVSILKGDTSSRLKYYQALENVQITNQHEAFYQLITKSCIDSLQEHLNLVG